VLSLTAQVGIADSAAAHGLPTEQADDTGPVEEEVSLEVTEIVTETDTETEEVLDLEEELGEVCKLLVILVLFEAVEDVEIGVLLVVVVVTVVDVLELADWAALMQVQTAPASFLAAIPVTKPQALVTHAKASMTMELEIEGTH